MADVALYLGLITEEQRFDLKAMAKVRDCYAHGRTLKQLADEPQVFALVAKTNMYKISVDELTGLDQQAVFMCVKEQLIADLKARLSSFNASSTGASNV